MRDLQGRVALVTGASRGVGASIAEQLAERGATVVINFRSKRPRAEAVAERVRALGGQALIAQADLTHAEETEAMISGIREQGHRLDLLILNASGGLEKDKPADYAWHLNVTAQVRVVELALPLMPAGGRVVFVTSHQAHLHGTTPGLPHYEPVAASKHAGEQALRARLPELAERGVSLVVVSGDLIENTITAKLLERMQPGLTEGRRAALGGLLTIEEFAAAVVCAATDPTLESGATVMADPASPALTSRG
ncbi:MAG TPA: SDR family oxidoreductase [Chthonomonadaceae bacterium]|nr:SDR family oxidoreductase [Chthonomonadaceae bacterium]